MDIRIEVTLPAECDIERGQIGTLRLSREINGVYEADKRSITLVFKGARCSVDLDELARALKAVR